MSSVLEIFKQFIENNRSDLILISGVVLLSLISFGAGRLTASIVPVPEPIIVEKADQATNAVTEKNTQAPNSQEKGIFVASINGTKYYLSNCSGAKRINEENKIWFSSKEEAEDMGYEPASNCLGL